MTPPNWAQILGETYRDRDKVTNIVARHLLLKPTDSERRADCVHPSEASHSQWCPRSTYYRFTGAEAEPTVRRLSTETVFEIGNEAHNKWQTWFREAGVLRGLWHCKWCGLVFEDTSPWECPRCEAGYDLVEYYEVPVANDEHLIFGHADGDVWRASGWTLIEAKTIGVGTLRIEAPKLVEQHTFEYKTTTGDLRKQLDLDSLWRAIRRPFPSHLRQGMIYCFCLGRKEIIFIYEPKFLTAHPKEFEVTFRREVISDILDECRRLRLALEARRPPKRPMWATDPAQQTCAGCTYRKTCWGDRGAEKTS